MHPRGLLSLGFIMPINETNYFLILVKPGIKIVIPRKLKAYKKPTFTDAIAISKTQRQVNKNVI